MTFGISPHLSVPHLSLYPTANPNHTKASLTRSKEMIKAWSQDFSATSPHPVWPTTRLSTFNTARTSPVVPRLGFRAWPEQGPQRLPWLLPTHWPVHHRHHHAAAWTWLGASLQEGYLPGQPWETVQAQLPADLCSLGVERAVSLVGSQESTLSGATTGGTPERHHLL